MPVEPALLVGVEYLAHVEDVTDRRFLEIAHPGVNIVDGCAHLGTVSVLGFHCLGEPGVGSPRARLEPGLLDCESRFESLETLVLFGGQRELLVHKFVQRPLPIVIGPAIGTDRTEGTGNGRKQDGEDDMQFLQGLATHVKQRSG